MTVPEIERARAKAEPGKWPEEKQRGEKCPQATKYNTGLLKNCTRGETI